MILAPSLSGDCRSRRPHTTRFPASTAGTDYLPAFVCRYGHDGRCVSGLTQVWPAQGSAQTREEGLGNAPCG